MKEHSTIASRLVRVATKASMCCMKPLPTVCSKIHSSAPLQLLRVLAWCECQSLAIVVTTNTTRTRRSLRSSESKRTERATPFWTHFLSSLLASLLGVDVLVRAFSFSPSACYLLYCNSKTEQTPLHNYKFKKKMPRPS